MKKAIALLGGSFNPPHIAHFRLAHEVLEQLAVEQVHFIPCANPPHKPAKNLLPFALRCELLESYTRSVKEFVVSTLEAERPGPSYTVDTLLEFQSLFPDHTRIFIMGAEDLPLLPTWKEWKRLFTLADIAVFPRSCTFKEKDFAAWVDATLPEAYPAGENTEGNTVSYVIGQGHLRFLQQPILEISSTFLRNRWLQGLPLDLFLPQAVLSILENQVSLVRRYWQNG